MNETGLFTTGLFTTAGVGLHTMAIGLPEAAAYVDYFHRHNEPPQGHIFSVGCYSGGVLVGVAICGRPRGRKLDNGKTLEVYRVCTRGHKNACSKLYAACVKNARKRGYHRVITYTLLSETAASVKASNFTLAATKCGKKEWNGRTKYKARRCAPELKNRWEFNLTHHSK